MPTDATPSDGKVPLVPTIAAALPKTAGKPGITIDAPLNNHSAPNPVDIQGTVSVVPKENNLLYRVYDANNSVVSQGVITVDGDAGKPGTFAASIQIEGQSGDTFRIQLLDVNPANGSTLASAETNITLD
jgi:hypothetical protein